MSETVAERELVEFWMWMAVVDYLDEMARAVGDERLRMYLEKERVRI